MKRADLKPGLEYAVRLSGKIACRKVVSAFRHDNGYRETDRVLLSSGRNIALNQVLMPWSQYEAEQKAKAERDAVVQEERERHAQLVEAQIDEQWAFNLQLQELRGELAARGVENYKHSSHGVTLSWADLAKVLGMKAP